METRKLQHTDLTVSRACFGTMTFGSQVDEAASIRMIDKCFDSGINFIDTANIYNKGLSETIVGKALKGRRNRVVLASKVRGKMGDGPDESGLSKRAMLRAIDESLKRLQTDYLDLYYLHQPDYAVPIEETLEAMDQLVKQGKVRYPASSNYAAWQVSRMLWIAEKNSYKPAYITQPMYSLLARGIEQEYLPMAKEFGISTAVYNPLAGGLLTGKQKRGKPIPGTRFDNNQMYLTRYWYDAYFDAVEELVQIANTAGRSPVSLALSWLLHHTAADCVILGASKIEHLEENLKAFGDGPLPAETVAACDQVWVKLRGVTPQYNR
ncbi:MAG TPA: aldo/keto reductase [Bryobacteraceae bacterium]|nr:aldo/keto reductase [Bryobacteraceae bacterium]